MFFNLDICNEARLILLLTLFICGYSKKDFRQYSPPTNLKDLVGQSFPILSTWRNKVRPNLPPGELKALKELISLQRNRVIIIKPCDKGAGIIVLKFESYMESCLNELSNQQL